MEQAVGWRCGDCVDATGLRSRPGQASCARRFATLDSAYGLRRGAIKPVREAFLASQDAIK